MAQALMVGPREEEVPYMGRVYKQFSHGMGWRNQRILV